MTKRIEPFLIILILLFLSGAGCEQKSAQKENPVPAAEQQSGNLTDKPLAAFQNELLNTAFEVATKIPIDPHIKDRSRTQEEVFGVSLKLDQPKRALQFLEKIDNWRRGSAYADLAFYCAKNGN